MKSQRGFAAAVLFLSSIPVALLCQVVLGKGAETVIHFGFAVGFGLLCSAIRDFRTPPWATWLGVIAIGLLAIIFALQGTSELTRHALLTRIAFQGLGQGVEGLLHTAFLVWCMTAVWTDSYGGWKALGFLAVGSAAAVRMYAWFLGLNGSSLEGAAPLLKLLYLMPFVWLLFESKREPTAASFEVVGTRN